MSLASARGRSPIRSQEMKLPASMPFGRGKRIRSGNFQTETPKFWPGRPPSRFTTASRPQPTVGLASLPLRSRGDGEFPAFLGSVSTAICRRKCSTLSRATYICMERVPRSCWRCEAYRATSDLGNATRKRAVALRGTQRPPIHDHWSSFLRGKNLRSARSRKRRQRSRERIGFYLFQATSGQFSWRRIVFGDAPVRADGCLSSVSNLKSEGLVGRSRPPSAP